MGKVNGVPVTSISSINGKSLTSITRFKGLPTLLISGWPTPTGCVTYTLGYRNSPPIGPVCLETRNDYLFDLSSNILYGLGETCGGLLAPGGFYSDGNTIYLWEDSTRGWSWSRFANC
jgi:hypothetical protein